jgi:hypothetical protein
MDILSLSKFRFNDEFEILAGMLMKIKNLLRCDAVFVGKEELEAAGISERHIIIYSWHKPKFPKA